MDWFLPGTKAGGPVRSLYSLIQLLKDEYEFYLVTGNTDLGETVPYEGIEPDTWLKIDGLNSFYFERKNISNENLLNLINDVQPDLLYLNSFWSFDFSIRLIRLKKAGKLEAPILLAPRGMLSRGAMGLKRTKKSVFLRIGKTLRWYKGVYFQATQKTEEQEILRQFPSAKVFIAPNVNAGTVKRNESAKQVNHLKLFYLSRIARVKNLHFALECLQQVSPDCHITYTIYGNTEDKVYWQECQQLIQQLPPNINVIQAGELPFTAVQQTLLAEQVLFLPTRNENFGHSIVEALLCGCPAIISDQTPWNDLSAHCAGYALKLSDKDAFRQAIERFAKMDEGEFKTWSLNANNYISRKIDLEGIKKHYRKILHECTQDRSE